jgi:AraC-like DNA-binding protein
VAEAGPTLTDLSNSVGILRFTGARPRAPGQLKMRRKLLIGTTALATAAFAGGAYAASQDSASGTRQAFLDDVAKRLHVSPQQLSSALNGAFLDRLQAAVRAGKLTQAQANAIKQRLEQRGAPPIPFLGPGPFGPPGPPPGLRGLRAPDRPGGPLAGAAGYLGLTEEQLSQQLESGKSLAQVAKARGKSTSGLEQAMIAAIKTRLDKAIANGALTKSEEQQIVSRLSQRIDDLVNRAPETSPRPKGFPRPADGLPGGPPPPADGLPGGPLPPADGLPGGPPPPAA